MSEEKDGVSRICDMLEEAVETIESRIATFEMTYDDFSEIKSSLDQIANFAADMRVRAEERAEEDDGPEEASE